MIDFLDCHDAIAERLGMLPHVLCQLILRARRPDYQYLLGATERRLDLLEIMAILRRTSSTDFTTFVMQVPVLVLRMNRQGFRFFRVEMDDMCLLVINPDNGVKVIHGNSPMTVRQQLPDN